MELFVHGKADSMGKDRRLTIRSATVTLGSVVADLTGLCRRHLLSLTHVSRTPSLLFGRSFCTALGLVLDDLHAKTLVGDYAGPLDLVLQVARGARAECLRVPFVVERTRAFRCLCKWAQPVVFSQGVSADDLLPADSLLRLFDELAATIEGCSVAFKLKVTVVGKFFVLLLRKFDAVLEVRVRFVESADGRPRVLNALPGWDDAAAGVDDQLQPGDDSGEQCDRCGGQPGRPGRHRAG